MIIILSTPDDVHATHVHSLLIARGLDCEIIDPGDFPQSISLRVEFGGASAPAFTLSTTARDIDLSTVNSIWYRRPNKPVPHPNLDERVRRFVAAECSTVIDDVLGNLECRWLPARPSTHRTAEAKLLQLRLAIKLGFTTPTTLVTNQPSSLLSFHQRTNGKIISKLAGKSFGTMLGTHLIRYTEQVSSRDLLHVESLRLCPMVFQEYVPKLVELRVTVVGNNVFTAEIDSQATNHTQFDWRRYEHDRTPHRIHELPDHVAARCVELVRLLGLNYGAIDLIVTPDGRYIFLEVNPNGQYLWIEGATDLQISESICDFLQGSV